jgi:aldehyde dehydrogenase (NAD+)
VARRSYYTDFWFRFPPWNLNKFQLLEEAYNLNYIGIVLAILGLKKSKRSLYLACN